MTTPTTTQRHHSSLTRDVLYAAHYYLWRPRVPLTLVGFAIIAGLALNWNWLVAAGLAPILIGTLPCLVMCAFGVCMICRSAKEQSGSVRDGPTTSAQPAMLPDTIKRASLEDNTPGSLSRIAESTAAVAAQPETIESSVGAPSCCNEVSGSSPARTLDPQQSERRASNG